MRTALILLSLLFYGLCASSQSNPAPPAPNRAPADTAEPQSSESWDLPDAPSASFKRSRHLTVSPSRQPYFPLTPEEKLGLWTQHAISPYTLASGMLDAGFAQAYGTPYKYGGGFEGYGKRLGAAMANSEASGFFRVFLFPTVLHQDPRYFALRRHGGRARSLYAASRVLITRKDNGGNTFNASEVLARVFVRSLANAYYPDSNRGFCFTVCGTATDLASDAGSYELREFWPDLMRLFHKHEPKRIKEIEEKLPPVLIPEED